MDDEGTPRSDDVVALTALLGSTDPTERDGYALPLLLSWVTSGALDPRLPAVGDGMSAGLLPGLGSRDRSGLLRRTASAQVLAEVVRRGERSAAVDTDDVERWADATFAWLLRERDVAPLDAAGIGAVGHGARVLDALAASPALDRLGLTVLLDVAADRLLHSPFRLPTGDLDLLARACASVVHRDLVPVGVLGAWIRRLSSAATPESTHLLRALHLRLALGTERPSTRADLLIELSAAVRDGAPDLFGS